MPEMPEMPEMPKLPGRDELRGGVEDIESLLRRALEPVEPPEQMVERLEGQLSTVAAQANEDLAAWREELSESELKSLRDPRNWARPAIAGAASAAAGAALVLLGLRKKAPDAKSLETGIKQLGDEAQKLADQARKRLP